MTFGGWQQLTPGAAAREVRRRADALPAPQRRAVLAAVLDEAALSAGFAAAPPGGPLRGIPYLLKDLFDVSGLPTFAGSSFLPEVRPAPERESQVVRDLRAAGAVLAGKTQLFEFAWGLTGENAHYGDCEHPRFPGRTSGGSSSGSAAAVAAEIVPFAIGTDTGGSIRVPAAFCGVFGYRGSPRDPWIRDAVPLAPGFDTVGWFTRSAADMRCAIQALVGIRTSEKAPRGCYLDMPGLEPEVASACAAAAAALAPPADTAAREELRARFAPGAEVYGVLAGTETWAIHRKWADRYRARYGPLLRERLDRARAVSRAQIAAVEPSHAALKVAWSKFFLAYDFLVMAAVPFPALSREGFTAANRLRMLGLTTPAALAGLPALTIPVPLRSGMTAGLQVIVNHPMSPVIPWALDHAAAAGVREPGTLPAVGI
jgi:amidase/aspartyl-tRNA(Asn)/glutamyl-tRNA(Gln) amidotransferase subunit A